MAPAPLLPSHVPIIDIRRQEIDLSIGDEIHAGLRPADGGEKRLPTLLLYDEQGLKLFEEITYLEEYYLTNAEIEVLEKYADHIAERIQEGSQVIELGSGNLRKVSILLRALERAKKQVDYYALDLSLRELQRTFEAISDTTFDFVRCHGLHGTYDDGLEWLTKPEDKDRSKCILSLGSSIGNFNRIEAAEFLRSFARVIGPNDILLMGIDGCQNKDKIYQAYNDKYGKTHEFVLNGLVHANQLMGKEVFDIDDWYVVGEYDSAAGRHHAFVIPNKDVAIEGVHIKAGEHVRIEESYKYSPSQVDALWEAAGLAPYAVFGDSSGQYYLSEKLVSSETYTKLTAHHLLIGLHLVATPSFNFSLDAVKFATRPVPTIEEWIQLWKSWDLITQWMIPHEELLSKPIKLRNACIFYLGHIPTFLDIQLTKATKSPPSKPAHYPSIFERGIDPDVDNPEHCHAHSDIPDEWPPAEEILGFQNNVRARTTKLYENNSAQKDRALGRALWLAFEHEVMHLETLLYMLLQSEKTIPPPGPKPDFAALSDYASANRVPNEWIDVPSRKVIIGLDDPQTNEGPDRYFGWDNETPRRSVSVHAFQAKATGLTNEDYALYLTATNKASLPASWMEAPTSNGNFKPSITNGVSNGKPNGALPNGINGHTASPRKLSDAFLRGKAIRTVYGPVPLSLALDWPIIASYDELAGCAKWMDGRIPTLEEARSIYSYVDELKAKNASGVRNGTIPAVNSHLSNEGVEESPPSRDSPKALSSTEPISQSLKAQLPRIFTDLHGCNVGFKHFHPIPITQNGNKLAGQAGLGGCWEWTSSVLEKHEGFEPMPLYPAYTGT
ncbi:hypothetical protein MMC25_006272 [Agyrium rufum]|nr:hypothetical protein [Agyrium rufum]